MVTLAMVLLAAAADLPPPSLRGPHFACRMTDRAGETFTVNGSLGIGRRRASYPADGGMAAWSYHYREARIEDSHAHFDGAAIFALSGPSPDDMTVLVRYAAGRNGRRIDIDGNGRARLSEDNTGDVIADGTCRLEFTPQVAGNALETRR